MTNVQPKGDEVLFAHFDHLLPMTRQEMVDLALLGVAARLVELEPRLRPSDFDRLTSLREFLDAGKSLVAELGFSRD